MNTETLTDLVLSKYPDPAWVTLTEVREGTGYYAGGSADVMAFGVWPSRGLQVIGIEVKVARSDWLRELKQPEKAEGFASVCDEWWLASAEGVAKKEEIPPNWGWYVGKGKRLKVEKQPVQKEGNEIGRHFLMSVVRNISKTYVKKRHVDAMAKSMAEKNYDHTVWSLKDEIKRKDRQLKNLWNFEDEAGFKLDDGWGFDAAQVGNKG